MKAFIFKPELSVPNVAVQVACLQDTGALFDSTVLFFALDATNSMKDQTTFRSKVTAAAQSWATSKGKTLLTTDITYL